MKRHSSGAGDQSPILAFPETKSIQAQASEWLAKLDGGEPTPTELSEFSVWLDADTAHRQAMDEMIEFWGDMNVLTQIVLPREKQRNRTVKTLTLLRWRSGIAALLLVVVALWLIPQYQNSEPLVYTTKVGEQQTIKLPDHTTVFLNTNSRIEVNYSAQRRGVTLVRGEAHFDVFHQPAKPFEVTAGSGLVRAIGTAFSVQISAINIEVLVTEGVVEIDTLPAVVKQASQTSAHGLTPVTVNVEVAKRIVVGDTLQVKAGSMVTFDGEQIEQVKLLVKRQIEEKLSWRQGLLVFKNESLQQIVDEVSRYTELEIIIPERKSRELKVGGIFKVGDTEAMFEALREGFGIHVQYVSDDLVYLISESNL
jgi:transmembrane sensor